MVFVKSSDGGAMSASRRVPHVATDYPLSRANDSPVDQCEISRTILCNDAKILVPSNATIKVSVGRWGHPLCSEHPPSLFRTSHAHRTTANPPCPSGHPPSFGTSLPFGTRSLPVTHSRNAATGSGPCTIGSLNSFSRRLKSDQRLLGSSAPQAV